MEYQDERGRVKQKRLRGFEARVFQHEYDHINGVLHIDRQSAADRVKIQPFLDVLIEQHGPGGDLDLPEQTVVTLQPPVMDAAPAANPMAQATKATTKAAKAAVKAAAKAMATNDGAATKTTGFGGGKPKGAKPKKKKKR